MGYDVTRARDVDVDLELIFEFLVATAEAFGDDVETAFSRAERRLAEIETEIADLGTVPHQGTLRPHLGAGIRNVSNGRAVFYFDVDDTRRNLRVLAVFYGGQDHHARVLVRLLSHP